MLIKETVVFTAQECYFGLFLFEWKRNS